MKTETLTQTTTTYNDGSKIVEYRNSKGKRHNSNSPAYVSYYKNGNVASEGFYIEGKRHSPNGPAYVEYYKNGNIVYQEFFIEGEKLTEEEFNNLQNNKDSCDGEIVEIKGKRYQLKLVK